MTSNSLKRSGRFEIRNTAKAVSREARHTGSILVRFPFNDYYRGPGKVFTGKPRAFRTPKISDGTVSVRYDNRTFNVKAYAYRFAGTTGEPLARAQILFETA